MARKATGGRRTSAGGTFNPVRIEVIPFGDKQVSREMLRVGARGLNMKPLWPVMAEYFYAIERKQFESEGGFGSGGWPELAESTKAFKAAHNLQPEILRATDALMKSLTRRNAKGSKRVDRKGEFFRGSTITYGVYHQSEAARSRLPQRKPVEFRRRDRIAWIKMMQRFVITGDLPTIPAL